MGKFIKQVYVRFSRYFPGYEVDDATLHVELSENGTSERDACVLFDVPWGSFVFEDGFEVLMEESAATCDAEERFEAVFRHVDAETRGLNKKKM